MVWFKPDYKKSHINKYITVWEAKRNSSEWMVPIWKGFGFKISSFLVFLVLCCCKKHAMLMKNRVYVEHQEIILHDYVRNLLRFVSRAETGKF